MGNRITALAAAIIFATGFTFAPKPIEQIPWTPKPTPVQGCCKVCKKGCACGNSCISCAKQCRKGAGCACDG